MICRLYSITHMDLNRKVVFITGAAQGIGKAFSKALLEKGARHSCSIAMDLTNTVVIITGASQGIGKAFAKALLKNGAKVCLSDINEKRGNATHVELAEIYGEERVEFVRCDVRNENEFKSVFKTAKEKFGRIDIVINNAGVVDEEDWSKCIDVNLKGSVLGTKLAADVLRKDKGGNGGIIVNMCSIFGYRPVWFLSAYAVSKYGVFGLTKSLAENPEMTKNGVRITCLCPAAVDTEMITGEIQARRQELFNDTRLMSTDVVVEGLFKLLNDKNNNGGALNIDPDHPIEHMIYV